MVSTVPSASITIYNTIAFVFHCFFSSLVRSRYLSLFSLSFNILFTQFYPVISQNGKVHYSADSFCLFFLLLTVGGSGRLAEIRKSVWISKSTKLLCVTFSRTESLLYIYALFGWSNFYYSYYLYSLEVFTSALADGFSLEFEWQ